MPSFTDTPTSVDVLCIKCGYRLRGLPDSGGCPECGERIQDSLEVYRVFLADRTWHRNSVRGWTGLAYGLVLTVISIMIFAWAENEVIYAHTTSDGLPWVFVAAACWLPPIMVLLMIWRITRRPAPEKVVLWPGALRLTARVATAVSFMMFLLMFAINIVSQYPSTSRFQVIPPEWVETGIALAWFVSLPLAAITISLYARWLARQLRNARLRALTNANLGLTISGVILFFAIAFFSPLMSPRPSGPIPTAIMAIFPVAAIVYFSQMAVSTGLAHVLAALVPNHRRTWRSRVTGKREA